MINIIQDVRVMTTNDESPLCRYHYDPLDRLADCTPTAQTSSQRFYLKDRLATEIQGALQRSVMQHEDQLLAQQQRQSGTAQSRLLATDQQRSVLAIFDPTRCHHLAYTPYGHRIPENGLLCFNGERPDPVTGHYLLGNGYRAFNPVLMRFNSPDSWSPFGEGGINTYTYCSGNPVNYRDPTGHGWSSPINRAPSTALYSSSNSSQTTSRLLPSHLTPKSMPKELIESINRIQPNTKRILTSADNAINHAKLIKYHGEEIESLTKVKDRLNLYKSNKKETIRKLQSDVSYHSSDNSSTLMVVSRTQYNDALELLSLVTLQRTYELNKKLLETLGQSSASIRTGQPSTHHNPST